MNYIVPNVTVHHVHVINYTYYGNGTNTTGTNTTGTKEEIGQPGKIL